MLILHINLTEYHLVSSVWILVRPSIDLPPRTPKSRRQPKQGQTKIKQNLAIALRAQSRLQLVTNEHLPASSIDETNHDEAASTSKSGSGRDVRVVTGGRGVNPDTYVRAELECELMKKNNALTILFVRAFWSGVGSNPVPAIKAHLVSNELDPLRIEI